MTVAVCTKNKKLMEAVKRSNVRNIAITNEIEDIEVKNYDLTIVDINICSGKLDVARLQSKRSVFILPEVTEESINKAIECFEVGYRPFTYRFSGKEHTIDLNDIVYFESRHRVIRAYNDRGEFVRFYCTLDDIQKKVDDMVFFLRVNKSYLVHYEYCTIEDGVVSFLDKDIQISRTYKKEFKKRLEIIKKM